MSSLVVGGAGVVVDAAVAVGVGFGVGAAFRLVTPQVLALSGSLPRGLKAPLMFTYGAMQLATGAALSFASMGVAETLVPGFTVWAGSNPLTRTLVYATALTITQANAVASMVAGASAMEDWVSELAGAKPSPQETAASVPAPGGPDAKVVRSANRSMRSMVK